MTVPPPKPRGVQPRISLILIDENPGANAGVLARIRAEPGFHVVATLVDVEAALREVCEASPDIVLLNLQHDSEDSLTLAGALHGDAPDVRVIMMGVLPTQTDLAVYVRACVAGFIMAEASYEVFAETIQSVAAGTHVLPPELTRPLFDQLKGGGGRKKAARVLDINRLTSRERAVTDLIIRGLNNRKIAAELGISLYTVKGHVHRVLSKLAVNSRLEIAAFSRPRTGRTLAPSVSVPPVSARERFA